MAERAVQEIEGELLKHDPRGGPVSELSLAICTARLNSRIRSRGLSAREMLFQRDQFNNNQLPIADWDLISQQHQAKLSNHPHSEASKAPLRDYRDEPTISVGDLVYLYNDGSKLAARDRYIVVRTDNEWVYVRKFAGNQLRQASYKVKRSECFKVQSTTPFCNIIEESDGEDEESDEVEDVEIDYTDDPGSHSAGASFQNFAHDSIDHEQNHIPEVIVPSQDPSFVYAGSESPNGEATEGDAGGTSQSSEVVYGQPQRQRNAPKRLNIDWKAQSYE